MPWAPVGAGFANAPMTITAALAGQSLAADLCNITAVPAAALSGQVALTRRVGEPDGKRYCWLKGSPTFDALRQACISPERAYVGETPPSGALPSQVISTFAIEGASWAATPKLPLNPGLITIVGARGSGKARDRRVADALIGHDPAQPLAGTVVADGSGAGQTRTSPIGGLLGPVTDAVSV